MTTRLRRVTLPAAGFLAGVVLAPVAAVAATASFTSSSATPAVSATNTTAAGPALTATAKGSGNQAAVLARNYATAAGANAFYSKSYVGTGEHYGIWGVDASPDGAGVRGQSTNTDGTGVAGDGGSAGIGVGGDSRDGFGTVGSSDTGIGVVGSGAIGVASDGELASFVHLLDFSVGTPTGAGSSSGDLAGTVALTTDPTSAQVHYPDEFPKGVTPVVVLTPTNASAAGASYYVTPIVNTTTGGTSGFTVNTAAGNGATFNYVVVGFVEPDIATTSPVARAGRLARAQAKHLTQR